MLSAGKHQILVVDDDPDIKNLFVKTLTCENYTIKSARSIEEALMLLDEFDPKRSITLVVDYALGDGTAIDLVVELLQRNIKSNNILVTGSSLASGYVQMFKKQSQVEENMALFPDQLTKPVTANELKTAVFKSISKEYFEERYV